MIMFNIKNIIIINVFLTSNNTIINVSNLENKTVCIMSCGLLSIKGSRRSTSYASQSIATVLGSKLRNLGFKYACIKLRGFGSGKYSCLKGFTNSGILLLDIIDKTSLPFNGCRSFKKRRI